MEFIAAVSVALRTRHQILLNKTFAFVVKIYEGTADALQKLERHNAVMCRLIQPVLDRGISWSESSDLTGVIIRPCPNCDATFPDLRSGQERQRRK